MPRLHICLFFALFACFCHAAPVFADNTASDRIVFGGGLHNVDDADDFQRMTEFRAEWHMAAHPVLWRFYPWVGAEFISGAVGWFGGGLQTDFNLYRDLVYMALQTGAGYFDDGVYEYSWRNMNPPTGLEFRHQIEIGIKFPAGNRMGIALSHMSNAGIGAKQNPGKNSLTVNFHIPFDGFSGRTAQPLKPAGG
ncbi:MAG: acyloxyacyl hydrolase [Rhodospirillales bacterium]|nr:acyloxyacyl hydrolase [Alphaproteobacteria bacterium]MCB9987348.1 acyloxyacyl hydrolase [Rhodospirillales bacterium]USO07802.1 MAG: acyloxyacyl hydrolase [Rhodospirillales bacterium]